MDLIFKLRKNILTLKNKSYNLWCIVLTLRMDNDIIKTTTNFLKSFYEAIFVSEDMP